MKAYLHIKDEEKIMAEIYRANKLINELRQIFGVYEGFSREIEVEIVPESQKDTGTNN